MPMFDLTLPQGALDPDARRSLVDELTSVVLRAERAPLTDFFRSVTWAYVHELPRADLYAGGRPIERDTVRLEVTTPEGALSQRRREELITEATRVIRDALGIPDSEALRVWVICREVPEGSWGAGGQVVTYKHLQDLAGTSDGAAAAA